MSLKIESEVKIESDPSAIAWDNKLYVGTDDGTIASFDVNLSAVKSWSAHSATIFALAAGDGNVYSASNEGGIRIWSCDGEKLAELPVPGGDICSMHKFGKNLFAGDEAGNVIVCENNVQKAQYNVLEEVKDIAFIPPFLFTVRDLDVTVTEIKPDESKTRFTTKHTMEGRAPLTVCGNQLLVMARGGNSLQLHGSIDTMFKKLHEVKVSDMIQTCLSASGDYAWTGGWDGCLRRWKIYEDKLEAAGEIVVGSCINGLVSTAPDNAYVIVQGGRILRVKS